ncbi:MAG: quinol dehydrogenase rane component [Firmicutes bacterium]|nr:quinol dehydrogenase rane component [Bacillota bacterium]
MVKILRPYLFWILLIFLSVGYFYPAVGLLALICMLAPVILAPFKGRFWCGNCCPRGSFYDEVMAKLSPQKPIPKVFRSSFMRITALLTLISVFTIQMIYAWGDLSAMGLVFLRIIFITTLVGIGLGLLYHHRTWCAFCPMGTLASWLSSKRSKPLQVSANCVNCKLCTKACPFALEPYNAKGTDTGFLHGDCLKCNRCSTLGKV